MATELVYLKDCYAKELEAKVTAAEGNGVELDKTIFYPEGGGQESDSGTIEWNSSKSRVKFVRKSPGRVLHELEGGVPAAGTEVKLKLDWEKRYREMRMHSAQHLLSSIVLDKWNASTVGNQIHAEQSRMDFAPIKFSQKMLEEAKKEFDKIVDGGREIKIEFTSRENALKSVDEKRRVLFDRLPEAIKEIRLVEIVGADRCPCGGTHVKNTKEIGHIEFVKRENKGRERERVSFKLKGPAESG